MIIRFILTLFLHEQEYRQHAMFGGFQEILFLTNFGNLRAVFGAFQCYNLLPRHGQNDLIRLNVGDGLHDSMLVGLKCDLYFRELCPLSFVMVGEFDEIEGFCWFHESFLCDFLSYLFK